MCDDDASWNPKHVVTYTGNALPPSDLAPRFDIARHYDNLRDHVPAEHAPAPLLSIARAKLTGRGRGPRPRHPWGPGARTGERIRIKWPNDLYTVTPDGEQQNTVGIVVNAPGQADIVVGASASVRLPSPEPRPTLERTPLERWLSSAQVMTLTTVTPPRKVRVVSITPDHGLLRTVPERDPTFGGMGGGGGFRVESIDLPPDGISDLGHGERGCGVAPRQREVVQAGHVDDTQVVLRRGRQPGLVQEAVQELAGGIDPGAFPEEVEVEWRG
ncbi:hypothetical protein C8Q80DRAFT_1272995 [Daedaleopsis nitida]|nr:hypothetical protein C8Q80DRAFT_1272995 [Daedaleopsis nitida]